MNVELNNIEYNAAVRKASQWTYRLIDKTKNSMGGTVISITIGNRYFFATAAHVISNGHEFEIVLRNQDMNIIDEFTSCFLDQDSDVGLLEIDEKYHKVVDLWMALSDMCKDYNYTKSIHVAVIGYPGEYIVPVAKRQITQNHFIQFNHCMSLCYTSCTIPFENWPREGLARNLHVENDLFIDYDPGGEMYVSPPNNTNPSREKSLKCPRLFGMSGGGIWVLESKAGEIWQPSAKLLGIQSSIHESDGWIRGTKIDSWLNLVVDNYPDLEIK